MTAHVPYYFWRGSFATMTFKGVLDGPIQFAYPDKSQRGALLFIPEQDGRIKGLIRDVGMRFPLRGQDKEPMLAIGGCRLFQGRAMSEDKHDRPVVPVRDVI